MRLDLEEISINKNPKFEIIDEPNRERLSYRTWVSRKHKYFYCETPKVACTSIKMLLHLNEGYKRPEDTRKIHYRDMLVNSVKNLFDYTLEERKAILCSSEFFRFCFVRNPLDRLISAYNDKIVNSSGPFFEKYRRQIREFNRVEKIEFSDFVEWIDSIPDNKRDIHWRSQSNYLLTKYVNYDFIGKFECFENDIQVVIDETGLSTEGLEVLNLGSIDRPFVDDDLAYRIRNIYKNDCELFGYDF